MLEMPSKYNSIGDTMTEEEIRLLKDIKTLVFGAVVLITTTLGFAILIYLKIKNIY